ncbi:PucR family transcriptional regulator [Pseudomonas aeruginosa]|uniref:PucR family transcriptional regulator n=1 Tax=Pseudomonas aeruginosa TaxID=287 RepID=UPI000F547488|nr:PucR family transcriptional regulator [Pseudomonas aeruginosa]ELH0226923.1 PucR family transcriptional regulator [Pseudomonas aeruginosa]MBH9154663.1 PucR family transcriptional regulator [Pseudomonas aeruginosa]MBI8027505.1 PucR family transcriptional regulator [Pseudomonas aeruginosa]MBI8954488.1 PucR family transcriptional regulator [Pseudomonas aeruginosa]MBI9195489.1 PucR family transcriptional regulator [Pseudomonas aeruginosa]
MLTVQDLLNIEALKLQAEAGLAGAGRTITWAHAVDLPDPWRWISPGDLVMTTGLGIPVEADEQLIWLEQLVQSNASALVFAPREGAPELSSKLLKAADRLLFPVLRASFELEFNKLSHYVIESVLQAQRERFNATERLFQTYAEALRKEPDMAGRLTILASTLELGLGIEDAVSGVTIAESQSARYHTSEQVERIPIAGRVRANLVIARKGERTLNDPILIRSLVGLLGVELERLMIHRDQQRDEGATLLRSLLGNEAEFTLARPILEQRGLTGSLVSLAIKPGEEGAWRSDELHHAPALHRATPLLLSDKELLLAVSVDDSGLFEALHSSLGKDTVIGISGPIATATGFNESVRQARLALTQAQDMGTSMLRYGEVETGLIMAPKSLAEARALVGRYLGPLIEHDRTQGATLLATLLAFLDNDGSWKATAFDLGIHRQTLVYRLKLVEQLTGIKPTTTQGIARFWIAIQAGRNTDLLERRG